MALIKQKAEDAKNWLARAYASGYDHPFAAAPNDGLLLLEKAGYIERDPSSSDDSTHWRITESGQVRYREIILGK